jgi:hypothetical protein
MDHLGDRRQFEQRHVAAGLPGPTRSASRRQDPGERTARARPANGPSDGAHLLPLVRAGIVFVDGVQPEGKAGKPKARAA